MTSWEALTTCFFITDYSSLQSRCSPCKIVIPASRLAHHTKIPTTRLLSYQQLNLHLSNHTDRDHASLDWSACGRWASESHREWVARHLWRLYGRKASRIHAWFRSLKKAAPARTSRVSLPECECYLSFQDPRLLVWIRHLGAKQNLSSHERFVQSSPLSSISYLNE